MYIFSQIIHCYYFQTLFRASLPHPTTDYDFVHYETSTLIPGIDLFSDRYRADISTVVASLNFIMFELHCAKQNLIVSIIFMLWKWFLRHLVLFFCVGVLMRCLRTSSKILLWLGSVALKPSYSLLHTSFRKHRKIVYSRRWQHMVHLV